MDTTLETVNKHSPFGAMLSRTLPSYRGPYDVGVCDVEVAVPPETFGNFTHKSMDAAEHGAAGLALETVLYSIYYPTVQCATKDRVIWFPNPWQTIDGFLRMAKRTPNFIYRAIAYPLIAAAIYGTTFPAKPNTPFLPPPSGTKWPLVIFSHGVGCSRLMYSTFCGEMASRGYVVCALEHRDGTSPCSMIVSEDGKAKVLNWLQWSDLSWPDLPADQQPVDDTILRHEQLKMRATEIYRVIESMAAINAGKDVKRMAFKAPDFDWKVWQGAIATDKPIMSGHSLGGSVGILAAADPRFTFDSVIAFDPAIQRLEPWKYLISAPLLVINSEEFRKSTDHQRLERLVGYSEQFGGSYHISGATHPSFSDVFLIIPSFINKLTGLTVPPSRVFSHSLRAVIHFLNGASAKELSEASAHHTLDDFVEDLPGSYKGRENRAGTAPGMEVFVDDVAGPDVDKTLANHGVKARTELV